MTCWDWCLVLWWNAGSIRANVTPLRTDAEFRELCWFSGRLRQKLPSLSHWIVVCCKKNGALKGDLRPFIGTGSGGSEPDRKTCPVFVAMIQPDKTSLTPCSLANKLPFQTRAHAHTHKHISLQRGCAADIEVVIWGCWPWRLPFPPCHGSKNSFHLRHSTCILWSLNHFQALCWDPYTINNRPRNQTNQDPDIQPPVQTESSSPKQVTACKTSLWIWHHVPCFIMTFPLMLEDGCGNLQRYQENQPPALEKNVKNQSKLGWQHGPNSYN